MSVAVATLGCDRKASEGFPSWPTLFELEGDYTLYVNYEGIMSFETQQLLVHALRTTHADNFLSIDQWQWSTLYGRWRSLPKFDQDQARLASIVTARNMGIEFAMQTGASHLLFIDADIIPPLDIIPKLLEVNRDAVCGYVHGRGAHSACEYIFQEKRRWNEFGTTLVECEHGNIGFCLLSRKLFEAVRFRYGRSIYPDGRDHMTSDDPAYHLDCFIKFGEWPVVRLDVIGRHIGDLKPSDVSQF